MRVKLIWLGWQLFILGWRITFARKLVDWRMKHVANLSDPLLVRISHWHTGLCAKFRQLEEKFKNEMDGL